MDRKYRSEAMEPIYESALANFSIGAISEERFREYERACFVSESPDMESSSSGAGNRLGTYVRPDAGSTQWSRRAR